MAAGTEVWTRAMLLDLVEDLGTTLARSKKDFAVELADRAAACLKTNWHGLDPERWPAEYLERHNNE